ncbi:MAG: tripartite tricarboxylate transporter substrate binding protein [Acidobacteria bacterium]|nr:tripartite tricarboxylate transporter substrate binding protein [Acidobacteriota bacterium]
MRQMTLVSLIVLLLLALGGSWASDQSDYPNREIEFIIPFPPAGPADTAARIIQPRLSAILGVPIVLINKPGGGGALGADFVARGKPDGYRVFATTNSTLTIITATQPDLPYQLNNFASVGSYIVDLGVITARPGSSWKTLEQLVDYAKKNPGKLTYGSAGQGTVSFFTMELFKLSYGLDIAHVPFQGTAPAKTAVLGGHVDLASSGFASLAPSIRAGQLIPLVTTAPKRVAAFPNVPTMAEKGFPEASVNIWMGLFVPAKTPNETIDKLTKALEKTMQDAAVASAVEKAGMLVDYRDPKATRKLLESEHEAVKQAVKKLGIRG